MMEFFKKMYVYLRGTVKLISLVSVATVIITAIIVLIYRPIYKVTLNGEVIGYCEDKEALQNKINDYMEYGEEGQENVAFVQIDDIPEYQMCLQKKGITTNDNEIFSKVKETGITYYRYYTIADDGKEKLSMATFEEAEKTINELKKKESRNSKDLTIVEKYEVELPELYTQSKAVEKLYEKKVVVVATTSKYPNIPSSGFSTSRSTIAQKVNLGITLAKPINSGIVTSRFGSRWGSTHTGTDIGVATGTPIYAAASGTVIFSGWKGTLGKLIVVDHGNGVQTYYAHCSSLLVSKGEKVTTKQLIAKVGNTGRSTGPHLHFEIRLNGSALNPQNYVGF